ncbi:hypothetical protein WS66_10695 [Burkholderia sp. LA-2-3-30-S1-D2]|nr:hypothetical protein WS66_10695 [Burkholderia sp. LA-2-3-30-S1-D2]KVE16004.1 hypothetical protein WS66_06300 [Burkholderia sp. LA-2-3-30-S1-D2]
MSVTCRTRHATRGTQYARPRAAGIAHGHMDVLTSQVIDARRPRADHGFTDRRIASTPRSPP